VRKAIGNRRLPVIKKVEGLKEVSGWKGNIFYPGGLDSNGFGIEIAPGGRVWFPIVKADSEPTQQITQEAGQAWQEPSAGSKVVHFPIPQSDVTDNSASYCPICGSPVPGKRSDRRYCSAKCRKKASRENHSH
jgi:hypothetical protein